MLFHLLPYLTSEISWLNVFRYQTFRAMMAFVIAFLFVLVCLPKFIAYLKNRGVKGQPIRDDGPKSHYDKKGTPTMGGLVMVAAIALAGFLLCDLQNVLVLLALSTLLLFCGIGFLDDWQKISKGNTKGLSGSLRLGLELGMGVFCAFVLINSGYSSTLQLPFFKEIVIPLGFLFLIVSAIVIAGTTNAVNLTDGLDGLAIGPVMTVSATYAVFAYTAGNIKIAEYLGIVHVPGAGELAILLAATIGAGLGFLWYNCSPAQIFMGDTGALGIGGLIGFSAVAVKQELVLVVAGAVFVIEALSVIIQRYYYKMTKTRVFRMAPIHHHFELGGIPEQKIVIRFWIASIVLALITLASLKLR